MFCKVEEYEIAQEMITNERNLKGESIVMEVSYFTSRCFS